MIKFKCTLIIFLFFFNSFNCQESQQDTTTVFILFNKDKNGFTKKRKGIIYEENNREGYHYLFYFNNTDQVKLSYREYANFDEMERDNPVPLFYINKSFLKNNKDIILTYDRMRNLGFERTSELLKNAKHIFLIDKEETNNGKILIKEVFYFLIEKE